MSDFRTGADGLMHIDKVVGDELDHGIDWSRFLKDQATGGALTITSHGFVVAPGLINVNSTVVGSDSVVRLSGGEAGRSYAVTGHVLLSNGERVERTFIVDVVARKS